MSLGGQTVVVTGAAKGLGRAIAEAFHREGAGVALLDIDREAENIAHGFGSRGLYVACDVSSAAAVESAFATIGRWFGGIAVLINNAGVQHYGRVHDTPEAEWDRVMAVNLKSAYLCARHAIPSMLARGKGVVINIASAQSFMSQANVAAYTTSKTALLGLTRSIAVDYAPKIRCLAVCPSTIDTPMLRWAIEQSPDPQAVLTECEDMHLAKRIATPEEIAELVLFLCSDKAGFMTGQPVRVDGGLGIAIAGSKRK